MAQLNEAWHHDDMIYCKETSDMQALRIKAAKVWSLNVDVDLVVASGSVNPLV